MPTYEYKREDGSRFEIKQGINDEPLEKCPDTGQKVTRVISGGGGVVYKGSGWYVTDYKDSDRKTKRTEAKKANGTSETSSSSSDAAKKSTASSEASK
ncbi:MAG TPA: FmdB family zinc ribbon protein [Balneolaceae bacterium]|nr:FmdB family zinc ribbon protein [Balneolaceae bacterium]